MLSTPMHPSACVFAVEDGKVRALISCPSCSRTMSATWPATRRFECSVCGMKVAVELPRPPLG